MHDQLSVWFVMLPQLNSWKLQPTQKCLLQGTADLRQAITHLECGGYPVYRPCSLPACCGCSRVNDDLHSSDSVPRCNRKVICNRSPTAFGALCPLYGLESEKQVRPGCTEQKPVGLNSCLRLHFLPQECCDKHVGFWNFSSQLRLQRKSSR